MGNKHKHYDVIVAWANGEEIQYRIDNAWYDVGQGSPDFDYLDYRIKPKRVKKNGWVNVYPAKYIDYETNFYFIKQHADTYATEARVACVYVEWEEEENVGSK
jgi:hypothetical protein